VILQIWDALPYGAGGGTTVQAPQTTQEFGEIRSLLIVLGLILKVFEVENYSVLD